MTRSAGPTLEDVAGAAGVSLATASRCLNNPESVRAEKRARILAAVAQLDYVPHGAARALASRRTKMLGAVLPSLDNTLFGGALESFQTVAAQFGYTVVVASTNYEPAKEETHIRNLLAGGIEALFLVGEERDPALYRRIDAKGVPYVLSWVYGTHPKHVYTGFDNQAAAAHLTRYLLSLGHRRFGVISGHTEHNDRAALRLKGVCAALAENGMELDDNVLHLRPFEVSAGREAFRKLMTSQTPPTAVICGAEPFAYGSLFEAVAMGIDVPGRVSVTGFDDMWLASQLTPSLTTVRTPRREMGEQAARFLIARLEGQDIGAPPMLDTELIVRNSTGPAPRE
jgi:LacI family transcriptional regulator